MGQIGTTGEHRRKRGRRIAVALIAAAASVGVPTAARSAAPPALGGGNGLIMAVRSMDTVSGYNTTDWTNSRIQFHADGTGPVETLPEIRFGLSPTIGIRGEAYSPTGTKVAITGDLGWSDSGLWIANADGTGTPLRIDPVRGIGSFYYEPRFSPDGSRVYFFWLHDPDSKGQNAEELACLKTDGTGDCGATGLEGQYAYDNYSFGVTNAGDVYYAGNGTGTGGVQTLLWNHTTNTVSAIYPAPDAAVSPDGTQLAYTTWGSTYQIWVKKIGTAPGAGGDHQVTHVPAGTRATVPTWSPDGTQIAYVAWQLDGAGSTQVGVVPVSGGSGFTMGPVTSGNFVGEPDWEPANAVVQHPAVQPFVGDQVGGGDRYQTAVDASRLAWQDASAPSLTSAPHARVAVLARGDTYADALAGSAMAAELGGPLLLSAPDALDPPVGAELHRVLPNGGTVYLLGGPQALSASVQSAVAALGLSPQRIQGADRFGTAAAIARKIGEDGLPYRIFLATGTNYPDALVAGAAAAAGHFKTVVLLTDGATMPRATADYLDSTLFSASPTPKIEVYAIGGPASVVGKQLGAVPLVGGDRYSTAKLVADTFFSGMHQPSTVGVAYGGNWPDALSGGALVGLHYGPLLLEDGATLPGGQLDYLRGQGGAVTSVVAFGGPAVMPQAPITAAAQAANATAPWRYALNRADVALP